MNPQQYKCKLEDVIQDEMAPNIGSSIRQIRIGGKQMPYVAKLQE